MRVKLASLTRFGTYGFLSALMAAQLATSPRAFADSAADSVDRAKKDVKKSSRSLKRDLKKTGRKVTGQENTWDDGKDEVKDAGANVKDEAEFQKNKLKRKSE